MNPRSLVRLTVAALAVSACAGASRRADPAPAPAVIDASTDAGAPTVARETVEARRTVYLLGPPPDAGPPSAGDGGAPLRGARDIVILPIPADPTPLTERGQWVFDLRWDRGEAYLVGVQRVDLPAPLETPRVMGRFALELFEGPALIERVRFDFPLLGVGAPADAGFATPPSFESKLTTRIGVRFPATIKGTRLELWDRATDRRWPLPWPPRP